MRRCLFALLAIWLAVAAAGCGRETALAGIPVSTPQEEGLDGALLNEGLARLEESRSITSQIILRNDAIVLERYYNDGSPLKTGNGQSITKSVISALMGIALREGMVTGTDQRLSEFFPHQFPRLISCQWVCFT